MLFRSGLKRVVAFLAEITLEIYIVQYPIIPMFAKLPFPINWIVVTTVILISAYILHIISKKIINVLERKLLNENVNNRSFKD